MKELNKREAFEDKRDVQIDDTITSSKEQQKLLGRRVKGLEKVAGIGKTYTATSIHAQSTKAFVRTIKPRYISKDYNAETEDLVLVDAKDGPVTVTLPKITKANDPMSIIVKKMDSSDNSVIITARDQLEIRLDVQFEGTCLDVE